MKVKTFVFNPFMENTYVVYDQTNEAVIIDCGCLYKEEEEELVNFIKNNNLTVKHLINTHLHLDHQFGNHFASAFFGLMPKANQNDESMIENLASQAMLFGIPNKISAQKLGEYINDGDILRFGDSEFMAISVKGHSKGGICFYSQKDDILFSGDVLFAGSIGRTDLPGGDFNQLISDIINKLLVLPEKTVVYSGHGPSTTIGKEKSENPFLR